MLEFIANAFSAHPWLYYLAGAALSFGAVLIYSKIKFEEWDKKYPCSSKNGDNQIAVTILGIIYFVLWPLFWSVLFWTFVYEFVWKKVDENKE